MPQTRRSNTSIGPTTWHGGVEELRRLVDAFSGFQDTANAALLAEQAEGKAARRLAFEQQMDSAAALFEEDLKDHNKKYLASLLKDAQTNDYARMTEQIALKAMTPKLEVTYKELNTKDSGSPDDVMHRLHVKQVAKVSVEFGRVYGSDEVGALLTLDERGAQVTVAGDEMFVNAAVSRFKELFRQQRPRLWWLRSPWFLVPFAVVAALSVVMLLVNWLYPHNPGDAAWWTSMAAITIFYGQWFGIRWLVPTFELIPAGHKSKSQWALGVVGTIAVSLIASGLYSLLVPPPK